MHLLNTIGAMSLLNVGASAATAQSEAAAMQDTTARATAEAHEYFRNISNTTPIQ
jgi:hypothetical protein